ncbi:MAG: YggU family protein [Chloroflexi bacterium]|nr:YggU family protein [Chloroflexota bacterium]
MTERQQDRLVVKVKPNARQSQVVGFRKGVLEIRIAAPPVEGKANDALIKFLSECLGVSKSRLTIEKGLTGRMKTITIQGLSQSEVTGRLDRLTG